VEPKAQRSKAERAHRAKAERAHRAKAERPTWPTSHHYNTSVSVVAAVALLYARFPRDSGGIVDQSHPISQFEFDESVLMKKRL
jgi:hypothetical protein